MESIDSDTAAVVRQITAEVKQGKPLTITSNDVDVILMNKLFGEKRGYIAATKSEETDPSKPIVYIKRKKTEPDSMQIERNLINAIFKEEKKSEAEDLPAAGSCSPSPPLFIPQAQRQPKKSLKENWLREDITKLQKEALEAQITKDRAMTLYYTKKLALLEKLHG